MFFISLGKKSEIFQILISNSKFEKLNILDSPPYPDQILNSGEVEI